MRRGFWESDLTGRDLSLRHTGNMPVGTGRDLSLQQNDNASVGMGRNPSLQNNANSWLN
jgi:hypothetical protein